ncbi:hypothetical protein QQS21_009153 [Conoideocrella luteorostrata]|uniref:Rdx family-domain-containing protein n=1 Tax=Conoideocrella luteorostrata TaxID=1105319 RepID=A0AAJ0FVW2_9HYPO|nr:hypothetical protein QQS21_009153 [Conoideocrella luteorostrata]
MATTPAETLHGNIFPRITIQFCTQCKWMLRAAYFAQELLSTFSTSLGEVALQPSTGGTFIVTIHHYNHYFQEGQEAQDAQDPRAHITSEVLWDRKLDGGFPETKELKRRVRDVVDPKRDLGHVDRDHPSGVTTSDKHKPSKLADSTTPSADIPADAGPESTKRTEGNAVAAAVPADMAPMEPAGAADAGTSRCEDCS